ncbi:MAG: hypothetical protein LBR87_00285 [Synergistaceae bacterium]|jgi:hypothetical protein|nr:hypothetical protein [Synergistaceae bacterium]
MAPPVFRGKITAVLFLSVFAMMLVFLKRDLDLPAMVPLSTLPDIMVENLDFARTINGRRWRVKAAGAESQSGVIKARSMDVSVFEAATGRNASMEAKRGEYSEESSKMWLWEVGGQVFLEDRIVDFTAPRADYDSASDVWFFSEGLSASDDRISVFGGAAKIGSDGVLSLGKGARALWSIE